MKPIINSGSSWYTQKIRDPVMTKQVVYRIPCGGCDGFLLGETARKFGIRKKEHQQEIEAVLLHKKKMKSPSSFMQKSAISDHTASQAIAVIRNRLPFSLILDDRELSHPAIYICKSMTLQKLFC